MRYTEEREELLTALQRVISASPHRASPDDHPWLGLVDAGAELDVAQVTDAYNILLESERLSHDDSVHLSGLWFEFGSWCSDQSSLAEFGRLLLVRFGLELGMITPEDLPPEVRAETSLQGELARAIAMMDPADIDLATCLNLIARAREAVTTVGDVEQAYRLVLLASKLADWATALRQPAVRAEAEDVAAEANHAAEVLTTPPALRADTDRFDVQRPQDVATGGIAVEKAVDDETITDSAFIEMCLELIDSLAIRDTPDDSWPAPTIPGVRVTAEDLDKLYQRLPDSRRRELSWLWGEFIERCNDASATRQGLKLALEPIRAVLGLSGSLGIGAELEPLSDAARTLARIGDTRAIWGEWPDNDHRYSFPWATWA